MNKKNNFYFPQLDAMRGIFFLSIFIYHAYSIQLNGTFINYVFYNLYINLSLSLEGFFILSAFLLTWLGINEYKSNSNFSFKKYFTRRVLRIWPLYYLIMFFTFVILKYYTQKNNIQITLPPAYYYLFFISNFCLTGHVFFLKILWTLSLEEQFYLVWGIFLTFLNKYLLLIAFIFILISILFSIYTIQNNISHEFNTLTYLIDFALGIIAAYLAHQKQSKIVEFAKNINIRKMAIFCFTPFFCMIIIYSALYFMPKTYFNWLDTLARYIFIVFIAFFILYQIVNSNPIFKFRNKNFLIYTGKISFGLYCLHGIVLTFGSIFIRKFNPHFYQIIYILVYLLITYLIASISYKFIEKPFLKMKDKLRRI